MKFQDVTIITVNYNRKEDTVKLIKSLLAAGAALDQIMVIDNHSENDSVSFLKSAFPEQLAVLSNYQNQGYADGLNLGLGHFLTQGAANWALLINNDTTVAEDFLSVLVGIAVEKEYSLLGPVIYYMDYPERIWGSGDVLIPGTLISYRRYMGSRQFAPQAKPVPVDFLNGCAMLVHRSVFEKIGLFDASFFMYAEEVDFCWRARQAGFKMAVLPQARMWHKVSASSAIRETALFLQTRNQIRFYRRYATWFQSVIMFLFSLFRNLIFSLKLLLRGKISLARTVYKGWKTGWFA